TMRTSWRCTTVVRVISTFPVFLRPRQRQLRMAHVILAANSVLHAAAFIAHTLGMADLHHDIVQEFVDDEVIDAL
ncbi:MAG: hypothetical protein WA633_24670, partial [Stellaceae bacterium]